MRKASQKERAEITRLDYQSPKIPGEVQLTRCPKCGGLMRGRCGNCKRSGAGLSGKAMSVTLAIAGAAAFAVGANNYDAVGASVGISPPWAFPTLVIGFLAFCAGMLWFAAIRFMKE
jgi:hypothetical protein